MGLMAGASFYGTERFEVLRRLGAGGMGVVYEAFDRSASAKVALKVLSKLNIERFARAQDDFDALKEIHHPNLVKLGELFHENDVLFFTMELVSGCGFLDHVRPGGQSFREGHLRSALVQLALGVDALHEVGKVHRDIKPSNIMVTEEGRVVLLDFGLVTDAYALEDTEDWVGTVEYMAPEQAAQGQVGPSADWYSVGVVLYEALVGIPPFTGDPLEIRMNKQREEPTLARVREELPADLATLCLELLRIDPAARPSGRKVVRRLGHRKAGPDLSTHALVPPFTGRKEELALLGGAFDEVRRGRQIGVHIHGESGIGKSALARQFTGKATEEAGALVLVGRCDEHQSSASKAMGGVVDSLASAVEQLPREESARLVPRNAGLLAQVFPVLRKVGAIASAQAHEVADPQELRSRVFSALRELFGGLSQIRPTIMFIDDLQWMDEDSLAILTELLKPPDAPPLLFLSTWREAGQDRGAVLERLSRVGGEARHLNLQPLPWEDARGLVSTLLERLGQGDESFEDLTDAIASEAAGNPLCIAELVRQSILEGGNTRARLEDIVAARVSRMEPRARAVLQVVMVAGQPLSRELLARAAGCTLSEFDRSLSGLLVASLVRAHESQGVTMIASVHDRIRASVLGCLSEEEKRSCHLDLARAFEASRHADPEVMAVHYKEAGHHELAARYAVQAGQKASQALAWGRAVRLFRMALDLGDSDARGTRSLRVALADALANAGNGPLAAEEYLAAAEGAPAADALDLRRRAAQQLLVTGNLDKGIATLREILASEGMSYPKTPARALLTVLWRRVRIAIRGLRFQVQDSSRSSARDLARIDVCYHAGMSLGIVDHIRGNVFNTQGLLLALKAGEPERLVRFLVLESGFQVTPGRPAMARVAKILDRAEELAKKSSNSNLSAYVIGARGQAAYFWGRFREAVERCQEAESLINTRFVGVPWELTTMRLWSTRSLVYLGEIDELKRRVSSLLHECEGRNDRYGETTLRVSVLPFLRLVSGDPRGAKAEVDDALARWSPEGFHVQHYYALLWRAVADLYDGAPEKALSALKQEWPALRRSLLLRVQFVRIVLADLKGRIALSLAASSQGSARRRHLAEAKKAARQILGEKMPWSDPLAILLGAGVHALRGESDSAVQDLREAIRGLDASEMALHSAAARSWLGRLLGGDEGSKLAQDAHAWMVERGIMSPERMTAILAPGVGKSSEGVPR
ncbi:MAG: protein kinase [Deltaproteobacteria bacterium]|nr:protein kinase [Deltaproteobacteria bacterium]